MDKQQDRDEAERDQHHVPGHHAHAGKVRRPGRDRTAINEKADRQCQEADRNDKVEGFAVEGQG